MSFFLRTALLAAILLALDWYFFQAISTLMRNLSQGKRSAITWAYWSLTALSVLLVLLPLVYPYQYWHKTFRVYLVAVVVLFAISKLVGVLFLLVDDVVRLGRYAWQAFSQWRSPDAASATNISSAPSAPPTNTISRLDFLSQIAVGAAFVPFASLLYGMVRGAFQYTVRPVSVSLPNLPASFDGLKIVHISDIHIGSFSSSEPLEKAVSLINAQKPDVVFFTGDLVNNEARETDGFLSTLRKITAPLGVFSTIGNHDYGDYVQWESAAKKKENFERLKAVHAEVGWRLLMNEHVVLERSTTEHSTDQKPAPERSAADEQARKKESSKETIAVIGIENWGAAMNFPKRGDLAKAHAGTDKHPVKLLLSHDPSHWDAQVRKQFPDVDVTFSGHTHGAQFGVEIPGFRWSPVQYFYKQWAGLYRQAQEREQERPQERPQYLYVNRGLGFLGYPGRVGILPEITVMTLKRG
jgi:uncharacterized protein